MSGAVALLVVDTNRSVPTPFTASAVPDAFTLKLRVPADSAIALAATFKGFVEMTVVVGKVSTPAFTAVGPV